MNVLALPEIYSRNAAAKTVLCSANCTGNEAIVNNSRKVRPCWFADDRSKSVAFVALLADL